MNRYTGWFLPIIILAVVLVCQAQEIININTADVDALMVLPRVGRVLAQHIIDYREANGAFSSIEDLLLVDGIGEAMFEQLRSRVTVTAVGAETVAAEDQPRTTKPTLMMADVFAQFEDEPTISEVQRAAIQYANIDPSRIDTWYRASLSQALVPQVKVTVGHDTDEDDSLSSSSTISVSGGTVTIGPDDITRGESTDYDWSYRLSLDWDLNELVFNKDQLSISGESEDMVELRNDIVDEVSKLYFDRRRLQIEMVLNPSADLKMQIRNELRLQELTAALDALTGGYFARALAEE